MKLQYVIIAAAVSLSACAKSPEQISAVEIADTTYANANCKALVKQEIQQTQLLHALSADQRKAQDGDALGVFLLGLPLSSMSGADKETEIAVAKGRVNAIRRQQAAKSCQGAPESALKPAVKAASAETADDTQAE